jgi:hypothetical protein
MFTKLNLLINNIHKDWRNINAGNHRNHQDLEDLNWEDLDWEDLDWEDLDWEDLAYL